MRCIIVDLLIRAAPRAQKAYIQFPRLTWSSVLPMERCEAVTKAYGSGKLRAETGLAVWTDLLQATRRRASLCSCTLGTYLDCVLPRVRCARYL